jgi:glycosyltransferase involved in cell wall biosynthesis/SAM-dependent methyltransferase
MDGWTMERVKRRVRSLPRGVWRRVKAALIRPPRALPSVTVVTPVYNGAATIRETIHSVLSQGYPHLEYIIVDGGSTDGTLSVLDEYRDRLACVISEPDRGMYDAIAKGFARATGTVLAYLNSDDLFEPGALRRVADYFADHPRANVVYHEDTVAVDGWRFPNRPQPRHVDFFKLLDGHILYQDGVFFRRSAYEAVGGVNRAMKLAGDWDLWVRLARRFAFHKLEGHRSCFRVRAGQLSGDPGRYFAEMRAGREAFLNTLTPLEKVRFRWWRSVNRARNWLDRQLSRRALYFGLDAADATTFQAAPPPRGDGPPYDAAPPACPITGQAPDRLLFSSRDTRFTDQRVSHVYYHAGSHVAIAHPPLSEEHLDALYKEHYSNPSASLLPVEPEAGRASPYRNYRDGGRLDRAAMDGRNIDRIVKRLQRFLPVDWADSTLSDLKGGVRGLVPPEGRPLDFLDVGCFEGGLLDQLAKQARWRLCGLELNARAVEIARRKGHRVWQGGAVDAPYVIEPDCRFDLIFLGQTIEHLNEPVKAVRRLAALLRPGGVLVLTTPNLDSAQIELFGPTWSHWHLPYHRQLFSKKSLGLLADGAALRMVRCFTRCHPYWTALTLKLNELGLGGSVSHNVDIERRLALKAMYLNVWAQLWWNWRGKGDYLVAAFRKPA